MATRWLLPFCILAVGGACSVEPPPEPREISLMAGADTPAHERVIADARAVLHILMQPDTGGLGVYLAPDFRWLRALPGGGSPTTLPRLGPDDRYFERLPGGIPLLAEPLPSQYRARPAGETEMTVEGLQPCPPGLGCDVRPYMRMRWRETTEGWRLAELVAAGTPRP